MKKKATPIFIICFFIATFAFAQVSRDFPSPLHFQIERNNIQVLPQKFEFSLVDSERIQLGDILIDANQLNLEYILSVQKEKNFRLAFTWPAALLQEGEIVVFNNYGKSIWTAPIESEKIKVMPATVDMSTIPASPTAPPSFRNELAKFISSEIDIAVLEEMKYVPFLKFCVVKKEARTRISLCSREFYFTGQNETLALKMRQTEKKTADVTINEKIIESGQALIFLNDPGQNINFRALTESGATLEIETRMQPLDFSDVVLTPDGDKMRITALGAMPVQEKGVKHISEEAWQVELPLKTPVFYVRGQGGIPLRQEFYVKGDIPTENLRPYARNELPKKTYWSQIEVDGQTPSSVKPFMKDKDSELVNKENNRFAWTLKNLKTDEENQRYLSLKTDKGEFTVAHQVSRSRPFQLQLDAMGEAPSGLGRGHFGLSWWLENLRWGTQLDFYQAFTKNPLVADYSVSRFSILFRFQKGFQFEEPTWGLKIPYQILKTTTLSFASPGIGFFYQGPPDDPDFIDWYSFSVDYYLPATQDEVKLLSTFEIGATAYSKFKKSWATSYGLYLTQNNFDGDNDSSRAQLRPQLGLVFNF